MCGLFGRIGLSQDSLPLEKLNVLGVLNDSRGGDSVGLFIDGKTEIGIESNKLYYNFMRNSQLLKETKKAKVVLGHTRKASVGKVSFDTAQPVTLTEDGETTNFVLIHNGTIFNYKELAQKYIPEVDIKDLTDTQVMAHIFYSHGYDALEEYEGAAVFIIADYRKDKDNPEVRIFKGASPRYRYSKEADEERPLFITRHHDHIWFSSIQDMLPAINIGAQVASIKPNQLIKLSEREGKMLILVEKEIDRNNSFQYKNSYQQNNEYNSYSPRVYGGAQTYAKKQEKKEKETPALIGNTDKRSLWIPNLPNMIEKKIALEVDGLYKHDGKPAHGVYSLNYMGYINNAKPAGFIRGSMDIYCFFRGRLLPNEEIYQMLVRMEKLVGPNVDFEKEARQCIDIYSYIPPINILGYDPIEVEVFQQDDIDNIEFMNGIIRPVLSHEYYAFHVEKGVIIKREIQISAGENKRAFNNFKRMYDKDRLDISQEEEYMKIFLELEGLIKDQKQLS